MAHARREFIDALKLEPGNAEALAIVGEIAKLYVVEKEAREGSDGKPLYLQQHRIHSGQERITVVVSGKPARAGIDPRNLLIDTEWRDNAIDLTR